MGEPLREQHADPALTEIDPSCVATGRHGRPELDDAVLTRSMASAFGYSSWPAND